MTIFREKKTPPSRAVLFCKRLKSASCLRNAQVEVGTHQARGMYFHQECDGNVITYDHRQASDFGPIFRQNHVDVESFEISQFF